MIESLGDPREDAHAPQNTSHARRNRVRAQFARARGACRITPALCSVAHARVCEPDVAVRHGLVVLQERRCAAVHIVIMGCGRVGSSLAHQLERLEHSVAVIDQDPGAFRRLGDDFQGRTVTGRRLRPRDADRGRHRGGRRLRRGEQRRQLEHHRRPGGARDVRRRRRWSPASTTPKRAEVYERLGIPTVATVPWTASRLLKSVLGESTAEAWRDPSGAVAMLHGRSARGLDRAPARRVRGRHRRPGRRSSPGSAAGELPTASTLIQSGDTLHVLTTERRTTVACATSPARRPRERP